ncbi:MAG: hypothetical protein U1E53_19785 [Dongiaceae bacterium]
MSDVIAFPAGGYRFLKGVFQYSAGVAALPGHRIERVRFAEVVPLAAGFERVAAHLRAAGRPPTAFCACELRSPAPFDEAGFTAFNRHYVGVLEAWGLLAAGANPVARSNVCPELDRPAEPGFHAFCYTVPDSGAGAGFVVAGSGEAPEGRASYADHIVARGDLSPAGLRRKAGWVMDEMQRRMAALGAGWHDATGVQVYSVHDIHPFLAELLVARGAARHGVTWHFARPPVVGLEYEMDCRGVGVERVLAV